MSESFADLQNQIDGRIGIAVMPLSGAATPTLLGSWTTGPAWSTIKVPLAQAALNTGATNPNAIQQAITVSDNSAATSMWTNLGAPATAGAQVQQVLRGAGDASTVVQTQVVDPRFTAFGQTDWALTDQVRFLSGYANDPQASPILNLMGNIAPEQQWGLGKIPNSQFKGGWGPKDGNYQLRQMGIIQTPEGPVAVALAVESPGESEQAFQQGQTDANTVADWIKNNARHLAFGEDTDTSPDATNSSDPTLRADTEGIHNTYGSTQDTLDEQSAAIPSPEGTGLQDPDIIAALNGQVRDARSHMAAAGESLDIGRATATEIDNTATERAAAVEQAGNVSAPTYSPAMMAPTPPMATPGPANPFAGGPAPAMAPMTAPAPQFGVPAVPGLASTPTPRAGAGPIRATAARSTPRLPSDLTTGAIRHPGNLTPQSSPQEVFAAVVAEGLRRGYSLDKALACASTMLQESGGNPRAVSPNGLWIGPFQQDSGYSGRNDPNWAINEFYNRLDQKGGRDSPDIWKSIFWLQQRPGEASAEAAYQNGRKAYMTEIQSQYGRAVSMYRQLQTTTAL